MSTKHLASRVGIYSLGCPSLDALARMPFKSLSCATICGFSQSTSSQKTLFRKYDKHLKILVANRNVLKDTAMVIDWLAYKKTLF